VLKNFEEDFKILITLLKKEERETGHIYKTRGFKALLLPCFGKPLRLGFG